MPRAETQPNDGLSGIVERLREMHARGERLPSERELARLFDVKRHQIRKALEAMRQAGDLAPSPPKRSARTGPHISEELVSLTNPLEVIELRILIEPGLARFASMRASPAEIARILEASQTAPDAAYGQADLDFHLAIAVASRNHLARELYRVLRQVGVDSRVKIPTADTPPCPKRTAERDAEHRRIAEAIADRDPNAAEQAMRDHLRAVLRQINAKFDAVAA
ncbi:FadR/GntR family transcriptional regulator [Amorphus orientalis]|uniref:DNA-binding FadR family transcriptional regulator n=1 Tax=Amorphus orientalis TaxID=649198 RepID=A0AAE3VSK3_9HYPH|nr:FCD domain-containing protein [Amorphus orientalis]MDQ0317420.1 DNA-binding FadR family transcriptional regulator [Amorphus orientalis]